MIALCREAIIHPDAPFDDANLVRLRDFSAQVRLTLTSSPPHPHLILTSSSPHPHLILTSSSQLMEPDGEGNTKFTLSMEFNVGGAVPGALVDGVLKQMARVPEMLTNKFKDEALLATLKAEGAAKMAAATQ